MAACCANGATSRCLATSRRCAKRLQPRANDPDAYTMPPAAREACGPSTRKFLHGAHRMTRGKRVYVLDTNVLMHDPTALFRFEEHDVFLPMTVLEELDAAKKGTSEVSRNARQVSRFINELIENVDGRRIEQGLDLRLPQGLQLDRGAQVGRLYFQTQQAEPAPAGK